MTKVTTIDTKDGTVTINLDDFIGFNQEAMEALGQEEAAKQQFKDIVAEAAGKTGMKKGKISKYFRARFAAKTKEATELGELFEKLDEAIS
jgi:predicted solute-binding protein